MSWFSGWVMAVIFVAGCATTTQVKLRPPPRVPPTILVSPLKDRPYWPLTTTRPLTEPGAPLVATSARAAIEAGDARWKKRELAAALAEFQRVPDGDPDRPYAMYRAAWCELALGDVHAVDHLIEAHARAAARSPVRDAIDRELPFAAARLLSANRAIEKLAAIGGDQRARLDLLAAEYATQLRRADALRVLEKLPPPGNDPESCERRLTRLRMLPVNIDAEQLGAELEAVPIYVGDSDACSTATAAAFLDRLTIRHIYGAPGEQRANAKLGLAIARRFPHVSWTRMVLLVGFTDWPSGSNPDRQSVARWAGLGETFVMAAVSEWARWGPLGALAVRAALPAWQNAVAIARAEGTLDKTLAKRARIAGKVLARAIPRTDPLHAAATELTTVKPLVLTEIESPIRPRGRHYLPYSPDRSIGIPEAPPREQRSPTR